ncbi:hypothetical protein Trydic_g14508 [Trypoxylus dichotomus]
MDSKNNNLPMFNDISSCTITFTVMTLEEMEQALKRSKNSSTSGSDGVPGFIVRECAYILAKPLYGIFNLVLTSSTFQSNWKLSRVCRVLKKSDLSHIRNYRLNTSCLPSYIHGFVE